MQEEDSYSDQIEFSFDYSSLELSQNEIDNQKFIGEKQFNKLKLSEKVKKYFKDYKNYKKNSKQMFMNLFNFPIDVDSSKSVCAKPIQRSQTIAQCYDCATDHSCIQCMPCFRNSNHQGHKVVIKKAYGGCCDCGDVEAWKKQGFCKNHTGESIEIEIDKKEQDNFLDQMKQIFFLLFWQCSQNNTNSSRSFSNNILQNLVFMNQKGVYYNKLTCMLFGSTIPNQLMISKNINNKTILTNILTPRIAKNLQIDDWIQLFFRMFQYYPFKKLLLNTYMKGFSYIYDDGEDSISRGSSIACQLLTSYQLVRQYALDQSSIPIGSEINIDRLSSFQNVFTILYHDLTYFTKLQGDTPQVYFKFHLTNKEGLLKLFQYTKIIKRQQDRHKEQPVILQLARFVKCFLLQYKLLQLLASAAGFLREDKQSLAIIIKILYQEALKQQNERKMIIFKPLTRALTLFIFAYFDMNMNNINNQQLALSFMKNVIGGSAQQFNINLSKLFKICLQAYLFHSKTLAQHGLNTTLYVYLYYYKIKNRFVSSLDILSVKIFSIMHSWPQISKQPVITPQDYLWQSSASKTLQAKKEQIIGKIQHLQFILSQLNLVAASKSNQLYVAYQIDPQCGLYGQYIDDMLLKILNQQKNNFTMTNLKEYQQAFFHPSLDLASKYMKKYCAYDKNKKSFILNKQFQQNGGSPIDSLNYSDFRCNITNKIQFQSPNKTLRLIKGTYNQRVYDNLYSIQTIKKFIVKGIQLMKNYMNGPQSQKQTQINKLQKLKPLFAQLMKATYIKSKLTNNPGQINIILEFLKKIEKIEQIINPFYSQFIHPQKIQLQHNKISQSEKMEIQNIQKKKSESAADQKKENLKARMQKKRKAIKQRYAKQLAQFQEEQKGIIEKDEIQEEKQVFREQKLSCIICKCEDQQSMIFLVKVSYKNHEKLLKLGQGVNCLSVMSCYHSIDYDCYKKLQASIANKKKPTIKCPFCKFSSNTFLPVYPQSKHVNQALKKLEGTLFMEKNFDQISVLQEIIKSFYHFSLLSYLDPQRTIHRRLEIYRIIFQILKQNVLLYDFKKIYQKFASNEINLNPKIIEDEYQSKKAENMMQLASLLANNGEDSSSIEQLSENQIQTLLNLMQGNQGQRQHENQNQNEGMFSHTFNLLKSKFAKKSGKEKSNEQRKHVMTKIFKQTLKRLFKQLQIKEMEDQQKKQKIEYVNRKGKNISLNQKMELEGVEQQKSQQKSENFFIKNQKQQDYIHDDSNLQAIQDQISPNIQICLKSLFDPKSIHHQHNNIYEDLNQNNNALKLRDLPINYRPLGKFNKCLNCSQISSSMALCLICDWQGCLKNCLQKQKKKGGSFNHSREHGQQSLYLLLSSCHVYNISTDAGGSMGCVYKDEWGEDFSHKKEWQKFFLDEGELNKIKVKFLHQE